LWPAWRLPLLPFDVVEFAFCPAQIVRARPVQGGQEQFLAVARGLDDGAPELAVALGETGDVAVVDPE